MTFNTYVITNITNIIVLFCNLLICSFGIDIIQQNHNYKLLYDLDVSFSCKKIFFYNIIYTGISGIFVLFMIPRLIYNIFTTNPRIKWYSGNWFLLLLMLGLHIWIYTDFKQFKNSDKIYCNNIYLEKYKDLYQLMQYQIYCFMMITGLYLLCSIIVIILKKYNKPSIIRNSDEIINPIYNN